MKLIRLMKLGPTFTKWAVVIAATLGLAALLLPAGSVATWASWFVGAWVVGYVWGAIADDSWLTDISLPMTCFLLAFAVLDGCRAAFVIGPWPLFPLTGILTLVAFLAAALIGKESFIELKTLGHGRSQ